MLMVFVLLLGLMPSAYAATNEGTQSATEPTTTGETVPESAEVPTDVPSANEEDLIRWAELEAQLPDPIEEYFPFAPEIQYPYGEPQDNFYPSSLFEADPYALMPMADMTAIPDEMYDNSILRALEYTGYDVQWLKDNGFLYVAEYVSSNINSYRPEVLSNIGYDDYAPFLNGDETVSDSSTVTGLAPDIASFESSGLVCASFVSYYINNYLPNIEGYDTSHIHEAIKATTMNNGSYSTASVWSWETGLTNLANTPGSGVTKYTDETTAYENIVPGDIIVFSRDDELVHVAIYAGTYSMWNIRGTNRGEKHFIIHVGNSRGPEISTTEYLAKSGTAKSSVATAWYHLELGTTVEQTGFIEIYKKDPNGNNLSGARFKAVDQTTGDTFYIGPTDSDGYAKSGELPLSTYVVTETVFPANHEASGTSEWTVTLTEDTPNLTITINAVNKLKTGYIEVYKEDEDGSPLAGAIFTAVNQDTKESYTIGPTDDEGYASTAVPYGTYVISETVFPEGFEASGETSWTKTINDDTPNGTVTVTAVNQQKQGYIEIYKEDEDGSPLAGAVFTAVNQSTSESYTIGPTDANGYAKASVPFGTYVISESVFPDGFEASGDTSWTRTINDDTPNGTVTVTAVNVQKKGYIEVYKEDEDGSPLAGAVFTAVNQSTQEVYTIGPTDSNGYAKVAVPYGTYDISESVFPDGFEASGDTSWTRTIDNDTPNATVTVNAVNKKITGNLKVWKATTTGNGVELGWVVNLWRIEDDGTWTFIGSGTTKQDKNDPTYTFKDLEPGRYVVQEDPDNTHPGYTLDVEYHEVDVVGNQTAEVTVTNTEMGNAKIIKAMPDGGSVSGWVFDVYRVSDNTHMGTYTSGEDGTILTGDLLPGEYQIFEQIPDDSLYYCESENPQTINVAAGETAEVTFTNRLKPAEILVYKVNPLGEPLAGVEFLLEWSEDGITWAPVTFTDSQYVSKGTCTASGLTDGKLVSGEDGIIHFTGLHPEMQYRLTETKAPNGYELIPGPVFTGTIDTENSLTLEIEVMNHHTYVLPMTGSKSPIIMAVSLFVCIAGCVGALVYLRKKEK